MKTLFTPVKAQSICSKTILSPRVLSKSTTMRKCLLAVFSLLLIAFQSKSISVQISKVDDACAEGIGSIGAFASGGTLPYTFVWSTGTTNISNDPEDTLLNLSAGTYSLTVYDAIGDSAVGGATLTNYSNLDRNGLLNSMNMMTNRDPVANAYSGFACPGQSDGIMFGLVQFICGGTTPFAVNSLSVPNNPGAFAYFGTGMHNDAFFAVDNLKTGDVFNITVSDSAGCSGNFTDMEIGPDYFGTHTISTSPSVNGQNNGSMTFNSGFGTWPPGMTLNVSDGSGFQFNATNALGTFLISNSLYPGTYQVVMHYNNTHNNCDTIFNVMVANTITTQNYYWVGGNGDWTDINHWSNTSGGAPFYSTPPTADDDVFFDSNSPVAGSCIVRFPSLPISECRNISVIGSPVFTDMGGFTEFEIAGSADFGNTIFQFTSSFSQSVLRFKSDATANLVFPTDLSNAQIQFSSANGTGVFNLASNLKISNFFLYAGTLNTNGFTVETESFSTAYTSFPRVLNLSNSQIILSDIPNAGFNSLTWYCDTNLVVNATNASFSSSAFVNDFKMRNTDIKSLSFTNNVSFNLANVKITSLRNNQVGSGNLNLRGSGFLSIDTLIASAIGFGNSIITGFDSVVINQFTNSSVAPLYIEVPIDTQANYCSINNLTSTNQVIIFSGENAIVTIDSLLASSVWLDQSDTLPGNININYLDCSLSQGTGNYNVSFFDKGCTIGTFILPAGDEFNLDTAVTVNIDTLIATGTSADPIFILGDINGPQSTIHLNKTFCGDYLTILGINSNSAPFYAGINSVNLGNNSNIIFAACGATQGSNYYWVGGTGNWNDVTHWATTSGGTTFHTLAPDSSDDVYFDANSFLTAADTIYAPLSITDVRCHNFDWTGSTGSPTFYRPQNDLNIYGSMNLNPNMNIVTTSIYFLSNNTGNTINTNGVVLKPTTVNFYLIFDNPNGEWILNSDLETDYNGGNYSTVRLKEGILNTNGFTVRCYDFDIFPQPVCTLRLGASDIYCDNSFWAVVSAATFNLDAGTSRIFAGIVNLSAGFSSADHDYNYVETSSFYGSNSNFNHVVCGGYLLDNSNIGLVEVRKPVTAPSTWIQNLFATADPSHIQKLIINPNPLTWVSGNKIVVDTLVLNNPNDTLSIQGNDSIVVNSKFIVNVQAPDKVYIKSNNPGIASNFDFGANDVCVNNLHIKENNALGTGNHFAGANSVDSGLVSGWQFVPCSVVSDVWPGDANYDLTVNNFDVLNIGLAYNETGPVRAGASNNFVAQPATDWSSFFQTGVNKKHADCNGDGIVDDNDTVAIALNYGQNHPARLSNPDNQLLPAPDLYLEINPDSAGLSDTVEVDVFLGTSTTPVDSIYGIAFTISFDTTYIDTTYMTFDYTGAWLGTAGVDLLTFQKTRFTDGAVDMAMVRTDHQNIAGFGFLERIGIVVVDNIGAKINTPFSLSNVHAITYSEYLLAINTLGDSLSIDTTSVGIHEIENLENMISVYPNPVKDKLSIRSGNIKMNVVEIYNSLGEMIQREKINSNPYFINADNMNQGVYLIRCITEKGIINKRIVIAGRE